MTSDAHSSGRIRIRSDGYPHNTFVRAVGEDGTEVPLAGVVRSVTWRVGNDGEFATAVIEFEEVAVDIVGAEASA